jgi:hypothetical protein
MLSASCMVAIRLRIAPNRPGGVLGSSSGHSDCSRSTVLVVASFNSFSAPCCAWSGSTACAICCIGQPASSGARSLQTTEGAGSGGAAARALLGACGALA